MTVFEKIIDGVKVRWQRLDGTTVGLECSSEAEGRDVSISKDLFKKIRAEIAKTSCTCEKCCDKKEDNSESDQTLDKMKKKFEEILDEAKKKVSLNLFNESDASDIAVEAALMLNRCKKQGFVTAADEASGISSMGQEALVKLVIFLLDKFS